MMGFSAAGAPRGGGCKGWLMSPVYIAASGKPLGQFLEMWYTLSQQYFWQPLLLLSCSHLASVSAAKQWMVPAIVVEVIAVAFVV